jgi:AraC-like DNA-binding protein
MQQMHELRTLIRRHTDRGLTVTPVPGLRLACYETPSDPVRVIYEPMLCVVAQGAKRTICGDRVCDYDGGKYLVVSVDLPVSRSVVHATPDAPYMAALLRLDPVVIASLLLETAGSGRELPRAAGLAVSVATPDLLDPLLRLMYLLDRPSDIPVLAPLIEREIMWRLLAGEQGAMVRQIGLADSHVSQIGRAVRWIRSHYAERFMVEELAAMTGMSVSSFHRHFKAATAMSPLQYQKQIRLQEARALLIARSGDVAGVGFQVGYDSPSQFSREYGRLFGVPPGRDKLRLREGVAV